jgi:hypothetical protein
MSRFESFDMRGEGQLKLVTETLKVCPLCGAVNALANDACFICAWAGQFDHDPEHIEAGLEELLLSCPELAEAINEMPSVQPTWWQRMVSWVRQVRYSILFGHRPHLS